MKHLRVFHSVFQLLLASKLSRLAYAYDSFSASSATESN